MLTVNIILAYIHVVLKENSLDNNEIITGNSITFFDENYPPKLKPYVFIIPVIYYRGDIRILANCSCVLHSISPSYYAQKVLKHLKQTNQLIGFYLQNNSMTKISYLCDIIYCNDMKNINENSANLIFSGNLELSLEQQLQLISILIQRLYVLEGFPDKTNFNFIANCIDNNVDVVALPTNIFTTSGSLPNVLIDNGIRPLLLYEK